MGILDAPVRGARAGVFGAGPTRPPVTDPDGGAIAVSDGDGLHNSFPSLALTTGGLVCVFRVGPAHDPLVGRGDLYKKVSADGGASWSTKTLVYAHATLDSRDPCLARLPDGRIALTFFVAATSGSDPVQCLRIMYSSDEGVTWTAPATVNSTFTLRAVSSGPIVAYGGDLLWPIYGMNTADTFWSVSLLRSGDNGATWEQKSTPVADGQALSAHQTEMNIVLCGDGTLLGLIRDNTNFLIRVRRCTGSWSTGWGGVLASLNAANTPRTIKTSTDRLLMASRSSADLLAVLYWSDNHGATWTGPIRMDNRTGLGAYFEQAAAQMVEIAPGLVACAVGQEQGGQLIGDVECRYIFNRAALSPNGVIAGYDGILTRQTTATKKRHPELVGVVVASLSWTAAGTTALSMLFPIPDDYASGDLTFKVMMRAAASGNTVVLRKTSYRMRAAAALSTIDSAVNINQSPANTNSFVLSGTIPYTAFAAGDSIRFDIQRLGDDAGDTNTSSLVLDSAWVEYRGRVL